MTPVLKAATNFDPNPAKGSSDITMADNVALIAEEGPEGTLANIDASGVERGQIALYVVHKGDTISAVARAFGVTPNTIVWANDIKGPIKPGDQLVILPISGVKHTLVSGETLASVVKKYKGDLDETMAYNSIVNASAVGVGDEIIVPYGVEAVIPQSTTRKYSNPLKKVGGPELAGYYARPVSGGTKTQGLHGYNGIDIGTPIGTPVMAAAGGTVVVARASGFNGGYGKYIVLAHPNGTQTVYGHLSQVNVSVGDGVGQGDVIGLSGNTGRSTGAHLHFEVRGAANPF